MSEWRGIVLNSQVIAQVMLNKMLFWHKVTFLQRYLQRHMWSSFICICGEKKQFIYIEWRSHLPTFKNYLGNALFYSLILWFKFISLTLERLGGQSLWFSKNVFSRKRVKPKFFCDFYHYHKAHLYRKFHWTYSSRSEDMRTFSANFNYFQWFFGFFDISFLQRN